MTKEVLTNQQKLAKRKFKRPSVPGNWFYHLVMADIGLSKHNAEIIYKDDFRKHKGPCFILWNHLSRLDHSYISKATYPVRFSMVAEYNEFFRSHLAVVFKLQQILPKKNFCADATGMRAMLSIIKQGGCVTIAPEALATITGYNERIVEGIGHLLKHTKIDVFFFDFAGQGLAAPVFSPYYRYGGKTTVTVSKMFTASDLERLSEAEIEEKIQDAFAHDEYKWQKEHHYKWNTQGHGCDGMHDICYKCPSCGKEFAMEGKGDTLTCHNCGYTLNMNEYLELIPNKKIDNEMETISDWLLWERSEVIREIRTNDKFSFSCNVKIGNIPTDHLVKSKARSTEIVGEGVLTADHNGIHYVGTRNGESYSFDLDYKHYYRLIVNVNTTLWAFYINGEYFEFFPDAPIVGKLDFIVQEMHRLHYNTWKCIKNHEYLYAPYNKDNK